MCGPQNEDVKVKRQVPRVRTTDGIEETITDPNEAPTKLTRRGVPRKRLSLALQSELRKLQHAAARGSSASEAEWARVSRAADKALALLLPDKGPRSMEISTVYMYQEGVCDEQDTENEYEIEPVDETQQCDEIQ